MICSFIHSDTVQPAILLLPRYTLLVVIFILALIACRSLLYCILRCSRLRFDSLLLRLCVAGDAHSLPYDDFERRYCW